MSEQLSTDITVPAGCTETGERMDWNADAGKYTHPGACSRGREHRALELRVYPLCTDASCAERGSDPHYAEPIGLYTWHADEKAAEKRLTGPELAAEYWCAAEHVATVELKGPPVRATARLRTIERFATLPHAAENGYL